MHHLQHACVGLCLAVFAAIAHAQTQTGGVVAADTVWRAAQSPYVVTSDILVQNGATLTIEAGTTVYMGADTRFTVQSGVLKAVGTAQAPITLTSQKLQYNQIPAAGDWQQLTFNTGVTSATQLEHVQIEYGRGLVVVGASPTFNYLTINNNQGAAIIIDLAASPNGVGNQASGNTQNAIVVPSGEINGSVIWGIKGIPYLVESGTVSVGESPSITFVSPTLLQQGESGVFTLTGSRLLGLSNAAFEPGGLEATVLAGGSATSASLSVTAPLDADIGPVALRLMTDAGEIRVVDAITVVQRQPKLTVATPSKIYLDQGPVDIILSGANLTDQSTVLLNGSPVASSYLGATSIRATIPNQIAPGQLPITLSTPDPINAGQALTSNEISIAVEPPRLTLAPVTTTITSGATQNLILSLPYPAPAGGVTIGVESSAPTVAIVPPSVTAPPGEFTAIVEARGVDAGTTVITMSRPGWLVAQTSISVFSSSLPSLLAEYRLDEGSWAGMASEVKDSTANANHGVAVNGAVAAPAKLCSGGLFDGTARRYVSLPAQIQDLATNTFTMMLWVRTSRTHEVDAESSVSTAGVSGQNYALYPTIDPAKWNWDSSGYAGAGISVGTNGISIYEHAGSYMPPVLVWTGTVSDSNWTHIVVTYNNGLPSLYVNGVFRKTGLKGSHTNVVPAFVIGSASYGNYSLGVDEYKIFDGALSLADIATIFTNENSGMNWDGKTRICDGG